MPKSHDTAPAAAPTLFEIHSTLTDEYGTLRLIWNTLVENRDMTIGEPVTEAMAEDIGAASGQLGLVMQRIRRLADTLDTLDVQNDLTPKVVALRRRRS